jgi:hypothetical protein
MLTGRLSQFLGLGFRIGIRSIDGMVYRSLDVGVCTGPWHLHLLGLETG